MSAVGMDEIVKQIHDLPSLPVVVMELLASMGNEDIDLNRLAAKITLDQSLTAKTLRLANSSFYGMQSTVTSIRQAIAVLGFHSIRTLVTACSVSAAFTPVPGQRFDFTAFWRHSVATAVAAKALAAHLRQNADTAFTAGLLHDLGTLVLATRYPARYEEALAYRQLHDCGVAEAEREVIFDRFSRGSEGGNRASDSGVGLGLALVDEHMRLHGGRVWVESRRDGQSGARFVVELPVVPLDPVDDGLPLDAAPETPDRAVLIADQPLTP